MTHSTANEIKDALREIARNKCENPERGYYWCAPNDIFGDVAFTMLQNWITGTFCGEPYDPVLLPLLLAECYGELQ